MPVRKPARGKKKAFSQKKLRDITWEIGQTEPPPPASDHIAMLMITPRYGHLFWHIRKRSFSALKRRLRTMADQAVPVVRVYDVTDLIFDGSNANSFFDLEVGGLSGDHYFHIEKPGRNLIAETGIRCSDGSFHYIARSGSALFDRDSPSGHYTTAGLFVGGAINRTFEVENIFDAPVYEKMNYELGCIKRTGPLSIANLFLDINIHEGRDDVLLSSIESRSAEFEKFGGGSQIFSTRLRKAGSNSTRSITDRVNASSQTLCRQLIDAHRKTPFEIIHCHDWYSSVAGIMALEKLRLPMVLTLYSTEHERSAEATKDRVSSRISSMEKTAVHAASLVIVTRQSTRDHVIGIYGAPPEKVVIIPHVMDDKTPDTHPDATEVRHSLGLDQTAPIVLFAGEISHASGADIMVDALPVVCRNHCRTQFIFAGEGPLRGELEARAWNTGIGQQCRFLGDVSSKRFESVLMASDFVVIPARTWQDEGVARMAISRGIPVLTTQQSGIKCVKHGENGLITFDNPGSIVWGIQELLSNPINGSLLRIVAKKTAGGSVSMETIAARHYMHYAVVVNNSRGAENA